MVTYGATVDEAGPYAEELAREENLTFIHPFDDEKIIAARARSPWRCWRRSRTCWTVSWSRSAAAA